jgi:hypothetical protein
MKRPPITKRRTEMNETTTQNTKKVITQDETLRELHEAELESVAGALAPDCWHWKNSSKSWGF